MDQAEPSGETMRQPHARLEADAPANYSQQSTARKSGQTLFTFSMQTRLSCTRCGDSIHPDTASRNQGLCTPCVRGNTLTIEERKARSKLAREEAEAREATAERQYWKKLVDRVYKNDGGLDALDRGGRLYFLITVLSGEVHNGGFGQFFTNTSGNLYAETVDALAESGLHTQLQLLQEAKGLLFGERSVPPDRMARYAAMPAVEEDHPDFDFVAAALDRLDRRFYADQGRVDLVLERIAVEHWLFTPS